MTVANVAERVAGSENEKSIDLRLILLKQLPTSIQSASRKERKNLFSELTIELVLSHKPWDDQVKNAALQRLAKYLVLTPLRYQDDASRSCVRQFLFKTLDRYTNQFAVNLIKQMELQLNTLYVGRRSCLLYSRISIDYLIWLEHVLTCVHLDDFDAESQRSLVNCLCTLISLIAIHNHSVHVHKLNAFFDKLHRNANNTRLLCTWLNNTPIDHQSLEQFAFWSYLIVSRQTDNVHELFQQYSARPLDIFVKHVIPSRVALQKCLLLCNHSELLAKLTTQDAFVQQLLPAFQKALLRNPEVAFEFLLITLQTCTFDLDSHADSLMKMIATALIAKNETLAENAVIASKHFAFKCKTLATLTKIIKHFTAVFNGSEGKLTTVQQRCSLTSGLSQIAVCRTNLDTQHLQEVAEIAVQSLITFTKNENHEATLIHIVNQLNIWSNNLKLKIPNDLINWYQTAITNKNITSSVRNAYTSVIKSAMNSNTVEQIVPLLANLVNGLTKAHAIAAGQQGMLIETIQNFNLFLKLFNLQPKKISDYENVINAMVACDKLQFLNEKFISSAPQETLLELCYFIHNVIYLFESRLKSNKSVLVTALVQLIVYRSSFNIRNEALNVYEQLSNLNNSERLLQLITDELKKMFIDVRMDAIGKTDDTNDHVHIAHNYLIDAIKRLSIAPNITYTKEQIVLQIFHICHLPMIHSKNADLWYCLAKRLLGEENVEPFVIRNKNTLARFVFEEKHLTLQHNCVYTLTGLYPECFMPKFIDYVQNVWNDEQIANVTRRDYEIFCTPAGVLYDTSVIDQAKDKVDLKNIRKENKLYSYQEQIEELKLRKELEAKKKPELTKKQLQAQQDQLDKETAIRNNVTVLHERFIQSINITNSIIDGNKLFLSFYLKTLLPQLLNHLHSPLCAAEMAKLYMRLHACVYEKGELACVIQMVQAVILRQTNPICVLESKYEQIELEHIERKLLRRLYEHISGQKSLHVSDADDDDDDNDDDDNDGDQGNQDAFDTINVITSPLRATTFTLILPFFSHLLLQRKRLDYILEQCLQIISIQIKQDFDESIEQMEDLTLNPVHLARKALLSLLLQVIEKRGVIAAKQASNVLIETTTCICNYPDTDDSDELRQVYLLFVDALLSPHEVVRSVSLEAMLLLQEPIKLLLHTDHQLRSTSVHRLWVAQFDTNEACSALACDFWITCELQADASIAGAILSEIQDAKHELLEAIACAMYAILREHRSELVKSIDYLIDFYAKIAPKSLTTVDAFGRPLHDLQTDRFYPRLAVALILTKIATLIPNDMIEKITNFHVPLALSDVNSEVCQQVLTAMITLIQNTEPKQLNPILNILQKYLDEAENNEHTDRVRTSVVVLMGRLAGRLDPNDANIKPIIGKLIETLSTPSQMVQQAVSNCLPDLCPSIQQQADVLIDNLIKLLLDSDNYGEKKGAAYGIAGMVSGFGILSMRNMTIIDRCLKAIQNKKSNRKLGALIAFEVFCTELGARFEPYVVCLIPGLLASFGDTSENIRRAAQSTSRAIMNSLSEHGIRYILPSLLMGLTNENWRTKVGSIEILGAMAFCAPRQLSSCLPTIVPQLMKVLCDSHSAVQQAANQALQQIGSVIRNPEISAIVPTLLQALDDPAKKTQNCLITMLNTKFVHIIDAPSLALIMPVIERAFEARSTTTRKMAAQIIGNMYSLTDQKDLAPYMPAIIPGIKQSLIDPVPDVRAATARALGAMVRGIGDQIIGDILPWLMLTLTSESSSVDRSGAAQGLAEVIGGLGVQRLNKLMPEIISTSTRTDISPYVKDGYLMLYIYLPIVFTNEFIVYIDKIIHPILKALADEHEFVRETAFKAGQRVVALYANSSIQLLLPELEKGLFNENWRIRYSSVQLLGDLLYKISGVTGKMTTETAHDDDNFGTEKSCRAIMNTLGVERRNRVLSGLYMGRMDVSHQVRTAALHVWKIIVSNTPRTLKEILPTLFSLLLTCLASKSTDQQQVAARTLGDLVRKLGERILPQILPILEEKVCSDRADERQGVCIGLSEIIVNTSKETIEAFVFSLVPTVRTTLCDPLPEVRQAAAVTFDSLHTAVGNRALDEIIPFLLQRLQNENSKCILDGLRKVLSIKGSVVLPYLIPQLTRPPINPTALSLLSSVSGEAIGRHLLKLLPALLTVIREASDEQELAHQLELCQLALSCIQDESSVRTVIDYLLGMCRNDSNHEQCLSAILLLESFLIHTKISLVPFMSQLLRGLIGLLIKEDERILNSSLNALTAAIKTVPKNEHVDFVSDYRNSVRFAISDYRSLVAQRNSNAITNGQQSPKACQTACGEHTLLDTTLECLATNENQLTLPGLRQARGLQTIINVYRQISIGAYMEQREMAMQGMCEIIKVTTTEALKSSVVAVIAPAIRALVEINITDELRLSALDAMTLLWRTEFERELRPILPQAQQSYGRLILYSNRHVRLRSCKGLYLFTKMYKRNDQLVTELVLQSRAAINKSLSEKLLFAARCAPDELLESVCLALRLIAKNIGSSLSDKSRILLCESMPLIFDHPQENVRMMAGAAYGAYTHCMNDAEFGTFVKNVIQTDDSIDWTVRYARSVAFWIALKEDAQHLLSTNELTERVHRMITHLLSSDRVQLTISGIKAATYLIHHYIQNGISTSLPNSLLTQYVRMMNHVTNEVKTVLCQGVLFLSRFLDQIPDNVLIPLIPMLVNGTKEKNSIVRNNAEQALICLLKLRLDDQYTQVVLNKLDVGPQESLQTCINKSLRRIAQQPEHKGNKFDDTIIV